MIWFSSLRSRMWLVVAAAALPLFIHAMLGHFERREEAISALSTDIRHRLDKALVEERILVDSVRRVLHILAQSKDMRALDAEECIGVMQRLLETQNDFANLGATYPDGRVFCSGKAMPNALNVSDQLWFRDALSRGEVTRGYYQFGRIANQFVVLFGQLLRDSNGTPRAVLSVSTSLDWITRMVKMLQLPEGWVAFAIDQEGLVLARSPDLEQLSGRTVQDTELRRLIRTRPPATVVELTGLTGVRRYYGVAPLESVGRDVYLVIGVSSAMAMEKVNRALYWEMFVLTMVFVFSALLGWLEFERSFVRWARQIGSAVRRFGTGAEDGGKPALTQVRELDELSSAFGEMTARIEAADIRRQTDEAALRESEQRLRQALEGGSEGLWDWSLATGQAYFSPGCYTMLGRQPGDFPPTFDAWLDLTHPEDRDIAARHLFQALQSGDSRASGVLRMRHGDGNWRAILIRARAVERDTDGRPIRIIGTSVDISEQKAADEERGMLAARIAVLLDLHERSGSSAEKDFLTHGLEQAERLTGSGMGFLHFVNEDQESLELVTWTANALKYCTAAFDSHYPISRAGIWANCFHERKPVVFNDYAHVDGRKGLPPGHVEMTRLISVPVVDDNKVRMILGVGNKPVDYCDLDIETLQLIGNALWSIAYKNRVERSLSESWERFYSIFNSISEAIFVHDAADGHIVEVNDAAMAMYGYSREELLALEVGTLSSGNPPYTQAVALERIALARNRPQSFDWQARRHDGSTFWAAVNLRFAALGGKDHLIAVVQDISERKAHEAESAAHLDRVTALNKKLEQAHIQLLQSEKLASLGQLAAGVAHEINNPVGYVYSNIGSLEKYLKDFVAILDTYEQAEHAMSDGTRAVVKRMREERDLAYLKQDVLALLAESREGIERVKKIVQDLKDFARAGSSDDWQWADIHAGLDSTLNIVWNELKYKTTVTKEYGELPQVYCLPSQLNQVFMNLLVNAAHAIATQGVVTVRTGREGNEVWVEVADTGCGISPENIKRIFDPFFTTKPVGEGTGLGLAVSYSIVQRHQGRIEVNSEVGKGSAFRVWLPIEPAQASTVVS